MVISHNMMAMNAQRQFNIVGNEKRKLTEKLASGYRINRASDDAAGLSISEKMRKQIRGLDRGATNVQDGISLCQVADGALNEVHDMLQRMNELAVQAANGTNSLQDRESIQGEIDQIKKEIDRIGNTTTFNGINLFYDGKRYNDSRYEEEASIQLMTIDEAKEQLSTNYTVFDSDIYGLDGKLLLSKEYANLITSAMNMYYMVEDFDETHQYITDAPYGYDTTATYNITKSYIGLISSIGDLVGLDFSVNCNTAYNRLDMYLQTANPDHLQWGAGDQLYKMEQKLTPISQNFANYANAACSFARHSVIKLLVRDSNMELYRCIEKTAKDMLAESDSSDVASIKDILKMVNLPRIDPEAKNRLAEFYRYISAFDEAGMGNSGEEKEIWIQSGAVKEDGMVVSIGNMNTKLMGINRISVRTQNKATEAIDSISGGIAYISDLRSKIGAQQNRLEHTFNNVKNTEENLQAAESRIRDTNMAQEMVKLSIRNMLEQAGISMMSQANMSNQGVLAILQ